MIFQEGKFLLNNGEVADWRINLDDLHTTELYVLAGQIRDRVGEYDAVDGPHSHPGSCVPRLVSMLVRLRPKRPYDDSRPYVMLLVDDVLSTGKSLEALRVEHDQDKDGRRYEYKGAVIFASGKCPAWIKPVFQLT